MDDLFDKLEVVKVEDKDYSIVRLANLQEGSYKLKLKKLQKTINITVHRGQYWESDSFILKRNCLFENRAPMKMIKISSVKLDQGPQTTVKVQLEDYSKTAHVHVYGTHFLPSCPQMAFMSLVNRAAKSEAKTIFPFA